MLSWLGIGRSAPKKRATPVVNKNRKSRIQTFKGTLPPRRAVLLYINTTWCGPCKRARPIMEEVARKSKLTVYSVDGDVHKKISSWTQYYPTLFYYSNGHVVRYPVDSLSKARPSDILAWSTRLAVKQ